MIDVLPVVEFKRWLGRDALRYSDDALRAALEETQPDAAAQTVPAKEPIVNFAEHKFASTQFDIPEDLAEQIHDFAASIPSDDLFTEEADGGLVDNLHITVKYGLHSSDDGRNTIKAVAEKVAGFGRVPVVLGKMSLFRNDECDVLKIDVASPKLRKLNALLGELPHTDKHASFSPHLSIAYLKHGAGDKYVGKDRFQWTMLAFTTLYFSSPDGVVWPLSLEGEEEFAELEKFGGKRAPKGGVEINGKKYRGGMFIPSEVANSPEGKEAIAEKKEENKAPEKPKTETPKKPRAPRTARQEEPTTPKEHANIAEATEARAKEHYDDLRQSYLKKGGGKFDKDGNLTSVVLNTDDWRELFPEYTGTNAADVHEASSYLNKKLFAQALADMKGKGNNKMVVLAGGGGSGKGATSDYFDANAYPIRLDQVSDELEKLVDKIKMAQDAGFGVDYTFVDRSPADAWLGGVVARALSSRQKGKLARTVPINIALKANIEARKTALDLLKKHPEIPVKVLDNNYGPGEAIMIENRKAAIGYLSRQIAKKEHDYPKLLKKMTAETVKMYRDGKIPKDIAEGLVGKDVVAKVRVKKPVQEPPKKGRKK